MVGSEKETLKAIMLRILWVIVLVCISMFLCANYILAASNPPVAINMRVGVVQSGWPPFSFFQNGRLSGIGVDFLRAALSNTELRITAIPYPDMPSLLDAACEGKVDVVLHLGETAERARCLRFSTGYFDADTAFVGRMAATQPDLVHRKTLVAVEPGFFMRDRLRSRFPDAMFVPVANAYEGLRAVATGQVDYYPTLRPVADYYLVQPEFAELAVKITYREHAGDLHFAFSPAASGLQSAANQGLSAMPLDKRRAIVGRWISTPLVADTASHTFYLTPEERVFLQTLPVMRVAFDAGSAPYSYLNDNGRPSGMAADYLSYLSSKLGVRFERVPVDSFLKSIQQLRTGKIDLVAAAVREDPAMGGLPVSVPYATFPLVIVGRVSAVAVGEPQDLIGKRVVVNEAGGALGLAQAAMPGAKLSSVRSVHAGMEAVALGEADAYVDDLGSVDVELQRNFAGTLRIIGSARRTLGTGFATSPALGSRLLPLISRAIVSMSEEERLAIQNRYIAANYIVDASWPEILKRITPYLAVLLIAAIFLLRSHQLLRREAAARKATEAQLQTQLSIQMELMDAIPIPISVRDDMGRYMAVNTAYEARVKMVRQEMLGHSPMSLRGIDRCAIDALEKGSLLAMETCVSQRFTAEYQEGDGTTYHFLCWAQPLAGTGGKSRGVITAAVEVSDIRRAEMQARAAESRLVDVTRHLPATVFQIREQAGNFFYVWVSGNSQELFNLQPDELIGRTNPIQALVHHEDRAALLKETSEANVAGTRVSHDLRLIVRGKTRWVRVHAESQLDINGDLLWNGYYTDLSEDRERADALERARDAAESASRAKDSFLAMMSHEIRTPMSGVVGLVELLAHTTLSRDQASMVGMIRDSAGALLQILDEILDYAKVEAGRIDLEVEPVDLRELGDLSLGLLATAAHDKGLQLHLFINSAVAAQVVTDSVRLRQILFNLLSNAIKFTNHGIVTLSIDVEEEVDTGQTILITVKDTGIGISSEQLGKLFEPFVQADSSTTRRFGGTGLGLSISRKLIELMGGSLTLQSTPDVGTKAEMRLTLPIQMRHYVDIPTSGYRAEIRMSDMYRATAIEEMLKAAGVRVVSVSVQAESVTRGPETADLIILDEDDNGQAIRSEDGMSPGVIYVTVTPVVAGYQVLDQDVRLSINPLTWRGLQGAVLAALSFRQKQNVKYNYAVSADSGVKPLVSNQQCPQILIVEDQPVNRLMLQQQLHHLGYSCHAVEDGAQALSALSSSQYFLLITDCHMPVLNGYELARQVRLIEANSSSTPLVILGLTASTSVDEVQRCLDAGMNDCLRKPLSLTVLDDVLAHWLPQGGALQ